MNAGGGVRLGGLGRTDRLGWNVMFERLDMMFEMIFGFTI
jgi:hypothetical protein